MDEHSSSTWHFFQREREADLWCAVPAHQALPEFLLSGQWHFSGHQCGSLESPPGFNRTAADVGDHYNGFYLFQLTDRSRA